MKRDDDTGSREHSTKRGDLMDHFFQLVLMSEEGRREWEAQQQEDQEEAERVRQLGIFRARLLQDRGTAERKTAAKGRDL